MAKAWCRRRLLRTALALAVLLWAAPGPDGARAATAAVVNDVTGMNPIAVQRVVAPTTLAEVVAAVRQRHGPISIGGGRYSMGGQTATEASLHLDMRGYHRILDYDPAARTITVQAGATWRQILEHIDPQHLSPKVMQTYANFTVGGSLSVNVHGRYLGLGPLILSVRSIRIVLADGSVVLASPASHRDIFYGAIGGYGGLGVIVEATLDLADNVRLERSNQVMPITEYRDYFFRKLRGSTTAVMHNADIYPDAYDTVNAVTYSATDEPLTERARLRPQHDRYRWWHFLGWVVADWPGGRGLRQHVIDPLLFAGRSVQWRNHEASYDVAELPPSTPERAFVLQEYFVPVDHFDAFVPKMRAILQRHRVSTINISIRHAMADPGSLLAWARGEVFAFVHYYQQGTDEVARAEVAAWTRELIDAALDTGGAYYLPYQPHATPRQFVRAYPQAATFFRLKKRLDPEYKFRNKLWDQYYNPATGAPLRTAEPRG